MTDLAKAFRQLSAAEALRALYIDFEGEKDKPPVLLGTLRRGSRGDDPFVHQVVIDPAFEAAGTGGPRAARRDREPRPARREQGPPDCRVERARARDRSAPGRGGPGTRRSLRGPLRQRQARGQALAEPVHAGDRPAENTLAAYLDLISYSVPPGAGPGQTGDTIRALRPALASGRRPTARQQERWALLLAHNQHDCAGMRAVCLRATRELDGACSGSSCQVQDEPRVVARPERADVVAVRGPDERRGE